MASNLRAAPSWVTPMLVERVLAAVTAAPAPAPLEQGLRQAPKPREREAPSRARQADELLAEIDDYCARTGTHVGFIGKVAFNHPGFVPLLRKRGTLRPCSAAEVRSVMARFPQGISKHQAVAPIHRADPVPRHDVIAPAKFVRAADGGLNRVGHEAAEPAEPERVPAATPGQCRDAQQSGPGVTPFERQLQLVLAGKAKVVPAFKPRKADPDGTLGGVATGML